MHLKARMACGGGIEQSHFLDSRASLSDLKLSLLKIPLPVF